MLRSRTGRLLLIHLIMFAAAATTLAAHAENWPQWRGPGGCGVSSETNLPIAWNEKSNVLWKCKLPEWGNSTPAIWQNAVFLTAQVDDEQLVLVKIDKKTGQIEWTKQVGSGTAARKPTIHKAGEDRRKQVFHNDQNLASPSPVTDGQIVVVHFGNGDLAAYDFSGKQLWARNLQKDYGEYTIWWGHANSPVLYGDAVISVCMQDSLTDLPDGNSPSYVVAHDKRSGAPLWKTMRPTAAAQESCDAYTTPILWERNGRAEMIVMGGQMLDAYDPASGRRLWWLPGLVGNRVIPSPVAANGTIYAIQGMRQALIAVQPGGEGKRGREEIVWKFDQGTSDSPSPVVWGELLLMVSNDGVLRCFDAMSGRLHWKERARGNYRASPVAAEGRIYLLNTQGMTTVVSASRRYDRLTENQLDDTTFASPAISDGKLFIRGKQWLYCVGN